MVGNRGVEEGELPILLKLDRKLDAWLNRVKMRNEGWDLVPEKGSTCVIHTTFQEWEGGWVGCLGLSLQHLPSPRWLQQLTQG